MSIKLEVWGDYACFTRPELKTERYSYDMMTPGAAVGILEAIFWHPGLHYEIDRIYVINPIRFTSVRRNEVKSKVKCSGVKTAIQKEAFDGLYLNTKTEIVQRAATVLKDVRYVIEAHFDIGPEANDTDNPGKFQDILKRRAKKGQCYHRPYFGVREFPAHFKLCEGMVPDSECKGEKDLGIMLHHMEYSPRRLKDGTMVYDASPVFFRAVLSDGVLDLSESEVLR